MENDFDDLNRELIPGIEKERKKIKYYLSNVWITVSLLLVFSAGVLAAGLISNVLHYTPTVSTVSVTIISNLGGSGASPSFFIGTPMDISTKITDTGGNTGDAQIQIVVGATGIICSDINLTGLDASQSCVEEPDQVILLSNIKTINLNVVWELFLTYNTVLSNNTIDISLVQ